MKQKTGFSLIEFLIYLSASSVICLILCNWMVQTIFLSGKASRQNNVNIAMLSTLDCYARDIMAAPYQDYLWIKKEKQHIVWVQKKHAIGYCFKNGTILRVSGHYDDTLHSLRHCKIASDVTDCEFKLIKKDQDKIAGVTIKFAIQKGDVKSESTHYIATRNS